MARALEAKPLRTTYLLNRASALAKTGRRAEAVEHLARATRGEPGLSGLLFGFPEFRGLIQDPRLRPLMTGGIDD